LDAAPDVVASPDARRAASVSSRESSRIAWPHRAGTPIATSWSTVSDATSSAVSNQFARSVRAIARASSSPRPTRWQTRVANASSVSVSDGAIVPSSRGKSPATTRTGPRRAREGRSRPRRGLGENPARGAAAHATRVAMDRLVSRASKV
jgi:hypothetical protein